jgi:hypothetical protein
MNVPSNGPQTPATFADWLSALLPLRRHLDIAHHIRGRLRLRLALGGLKAVSPEIVARLQQQMESVPAIRSVRANLAALSVVIEYDPDRIPADWWQALLRASDDEARRLLARLDA